MKTVKEKIIQRIENITDQDLLKEVYIILQDIQETKYIIELNDAQKANIEEARTEYAKGEFHTTKETLSN